MAGVPATDARETEVSDFRTHFKMPEYATRKQWEARKQRRPSLAEVEADYIRETLAAT